MAQPLKPGLTSKMTRVKNNSGTLGLGSPGLARQRPPVPFQSFEFCFAVLGIELKLSSMPVKFPTTELGVSSVSLFK